MMLDPITQALMTALVVIISGVIFISETLLRREEGAGQVWALSYLAAILTALTYLGWATTPDMWWAVAVGNMMFVAAVGLLWLGCRKFNGRLSPLSWGLVIAGALVAFATVIIDGPNGGIWAGAGAKCITVAVFAGAATVETLRGALRANLNAGILTIAFGVQSLYYLLRTIALLMLGHENEMFLRWFSTEITNYFTVVLVVTTLAITSVLRAERARLRGHPESSTALYSSDQVLYEASFSKMFIDWVQRAQARREPVVVTAIVLEELETLATAFGESTVVEVVDSWVAGVRRHAPASALIGEDGLGRLLVVTENMSVNDAKEQALRIFNGLLDDAGMGVSVVRPAIGIGIALSSTAGYDTEALLDGARAAAARATQNLELSIVVAV